MPRFIEHIGDIVFSRTTKGELCVEWRIWRILSLRCRPGDYYESPTFRICNNSWNLIVVPYSQIESAASEWMDLRLYRFDEGPPKTVHVTVGIKGAVGVEREVERKFTNNDYYDWYKFCSRSELNEQKSILLLDGALTVTCVIKNVVPRAATASANSEGAIAPTAPPLDLIDVSSERNASIRNDSEIREPGSSDNKSRTSDKQGFKFREFVGNILKTQVASYIPFFGRPRDEAQSLTKGEREQQSSGECIICYEKPVDSALYRCGHTCMCYECAFKLWKSNSSAQCPICRNSIQDVLKIYK